MMSGGIDSPVAGYLTLKRGVDIECIHFAAPPYTNELAREKVLIWRLINYSKYTWSNKSACILLILLNCN